MTNYIVEIPIAGAMSTEVEADSPEAALEKAWDKYNEEGPEAFDVEWEAHKRLTSGNVLHAPVNEESAWES